MIPQATPLYGYAWGPGGGPDQIDQVLVIGWEREGDDDFVEYRPVVAALGSTNPGTAFALSDDWTWHLTVALPDEYEGYRIKAAHEREIAAVKELRELRRKAASEGQ